MNKKVLTLCASFLLAGGLTSSALATDIPTAAADANQYYYVFVNPGSAPTSGVVGALGVSSVLDVNGTIASPEQRYSTETNQSTWWRVETVTTDVNGQKRVVGYKLINALTGKPLSVTEPNGTVYDIFGTNPGALEFADKNGSATRMWYTGMNGDDITTTSTDAWYYSLLAVETENLKASEINKVKNGYFGLQFGYMDNGAYVNYEALEGVNPFAGDLVAYSNSNKELSAFKKELGSVFKIATTDNDREKFMIYNKTADAYVVLLKEKWSKNNTNHRPEVEGNGHQYALMTAKQIIEDQKQSKAEDRKIASYVFSVNMPVVVNYSPLEVVAVDAYTKNDETTQADLEMYIANMGGVDYLTTTKAGNSTTPDDADNVAVDEIYTVVRFGGTDYSDLSEFYGWAITIKGLKGEGVENMTLRSDIAVNTNVNGTWTKAEYVAFSRPEAQWIVTSQNGTIVLTNRETKQSLRWDEAFDMLSGSLSLRHESGDTYVSGDYKFEIKKVAELGGETFNHYGVYEKDASEIGTTRTYKVAFADAFGATTYVGMDGKGNVELTRDEANAINFDLVKTVTTDTLLNNGTVAENTKTDVFHIVNDYMKYNEKTKEWDFTANGDTLSYFRYALAYGDKYLKYNEKAKDFELVGQKYVYKDADAADKEVDYGKSTLADNFIVKLKENGKLNIVKTLNYEMEDIEDATILSNETTMGISIFNSSLANSSEGEKLLGAAGEMMFFDFNNAEVQKQENIYAWNANAQLTIVRDTLDSYRYFATPDTMEFYRVEYADEFLYEKVQNGINFLGMTYDRKTYNPAIYVDTAYIQDTKKPTYLLALAPEIEPSHKYCPTHGIDPDASVCVPEHQTTIPGYVTARYLVSFTDSVAKHAAELKNPYLEDGKYTKLGFIDAVHGVNDLNIIQNGDTVKTYELTDAAAKAALNPVEFAFRIANQETKSFYIESVDNGKVSYIRWQNGVPVLTTDITDAEEFNVRETSENPTANEEISAEEATVSVVATDGAVIVKGAEGKNVIVSTILGKVVANETVNSDNETIAAPAGIVVVAVDGESFKVVVK